MIINKKLHVNTTLFIISLLTYMVGIFFVTNLEGLLMLVIFLFSHWSWVFGKRPEYKKNYAKDENNEGQKNA